MTKVEDLQDTITKELTAFYEDRHMDNPAREARLFVGSLIDAVRTEVGKHEGWVIATADGRFHSFVLDSFLQAQRMCAYEEHVVRVTYDAMTSEETAAQHKMVEEFTKGIDKSMIEAINFRPDKEKP